MLCEARNLSWTMPPLYQELTLCEQCTSMCNVTPHTLYEWQFFVFTNFLVITIFHAFFKVLKIDMIACNVVIEFLV